MKTIPTALFATLALVGATACGSKQAEATDEAPKTLVLYYSQTGATKAVAENIASALGADIEAIEVVAPYDGTYDETIQRCIQERSTNSYPEIKQLQADLSQYDRIFLGYPIWFGTYALPIYSVVATNDFAGKEVVTFCTFGSGGIEPSTADLQAALPKATVKEGYGVRNARIADMPQEVNYFLISNGYLEGEAETLPEYSEQVPVTDADVAVFDAACGSYMFPLGTPVTVGKRQTSRSTDYVFTAATPGTDMTSTIYVTQVDTLAPVFTRVVR